MTQATSGYSVGIDLGTTYSCVGVWQNDRVEIIANDQGNRTTPSYVAFTDSERLIGDAAKNQVAMNAANTVFDAKRLIGRKFSDPVVQDDIKHWPFKLTSGPGDKPQITVQFKGESKTFQPEEISSMVLIKMREVAEAFIGKEVKNAVITSEDEANKVRIEAKNALENYAYSLRNSLNDEKMKEKIPEADKKVVDDKVTEVIQWLDAQQSLEKEEYESKQKELEAVANPVLQKVYASAGGAGGGDMPGGMPGGMSGAGAAPSSSSGTDQGPKIEEVD
ncbi:hypothetical protein PC110_g4176 [Phytophthora cactorum]|uniref:Uncharacterized protein n=1 Tax=Phytophthora cactorum TaxID=29920 RepID=A0A329SVP3_9STRA|nr:hypothetical protein PC110_g4176 [Phytophthora cactorum]